MKTAKWIGAWLLLLTSISQRAGYAQESADSLSHINLSATPLQSDVIALSGTNMPQLRSWSDEQLSVLVGALNEVPTIPAASLRGRGMGGTYWSLSQPGMPPLPGDMIGANVWQMADGSFLLDDLNFDYSAVSAGSTQMSAMDSELSGPPDFGDTNTNSSPDNATTSTPIDSWGTNLCIIETAVSTGNVSGVISNTTADVQMELQYTTNLLLQPWQSAKPNWFVYGSETTNWTPWSVPAISSPNLFLRVRSWGSEDGSGLPTWWEQQNGLVNVNPNALDFAGDGWTIYQKYAMGLNPSAWATPPAPQGFTSIYNPNSNTARLTWIPSPGNVAGYTIEKTDSYNNSTNVQYIHLTGTNTTYLDTFSSETPDAVNGNDYDVTYQLAAIYTNGYASCWSAQLPLQQITVSAAISPGTNGATFLAVSGVPANASLVRLVFIDENAVNNGDTSVKYNENIPVSSFTNGLYQMPTAWLPPTTDAYGDANYYMFAESVDSNGDTSAANFFDGQVWWPGASYNWGTPFYDGRVQLKQNLIFQLRAAPIDGSLQFNYTSSGYWTTDIFPANYAVASVYQYAEQSAYPGTVDAFLPFEENYLCRNLVFTTTNVDSDGNLTTGASNGNGTSSVNLSNPTFAFNSALTPYQAWLPTNSTSWLLYDQINDSDNLQDVGIINTSTDNQGEITISMAPGMYNWFGLRYFSAGVVGDSATTGNLVNNVVTAGNGTTSWDFSNPYNIYIQPAQPQFQAVEYDFWTAENSDNSITALPGDPNFSTTNKSQLQITPLGNESYIVAGYAKLAVANSVYASSPNKVYGYLGQYFGAAYTMTNNVATSTNTGVLSPYGNFLATQPGPTALVTMPDPNTGAQGTCTVYVVSLVLDKNHDSVMDLSFNGPDSTSASSPYIFWCDSNFDRWDNDSIFHMPEQDDQQIAFSPVAPSTITPDCNYSNVLANGYAYRAIPCTRDLEDFARLWVCGITTNLLTLLPTNSTITLSWGDVGNPNSANPTIDLFQAADADGGIGYQTNETVAVTQTNALQSRYVGRLGPGQSIQLNPSSGWAGNHFIWCGVNNGSGGLTLTIADGSGNTLAQTTSYIQIVDIKQLYERWTVGDQPSVAPLTHAILTTEGLSAGESAFEYTLPTDTSTPYILLAHGYNMKPWEKDRYAETAYKRLYWQGYQGRFGAFNWPTAQNPVQFGSSESQAWQSAQGLLNKLNDLNAIYPGHVYLAAHSLGNVVAGEALRLAGSTQVVNTYVAMQGAVSSHAYDPTTTPYTLTEDWGAPDCYAHYWTSGAPCYFNSSVGAGTYVNFYNTNDWALNKAWLLFQNSKPVLDLNYSFTPPDFYYKNSGSTELFFPGNTYELFDEIIQSRSYALGMQPNVGGVFSTNNQVELDIPPYNFSTEHIYHSGEFRSDNPQRWQFWNEVLVKMRLKSP